MRDAFRKVAGNKGSGGIDGMEYDELMPYFCKHHKELGTSILEGSYKLKPVRRVEIPKDELFQVCRCKKKGYKHQTNG